MPDMDEAEAARTYVALVAAVRNHDQEAVDALLTDCPHWLSAMIALHAVKGMIDNFDLVAGGVLVDELGRQPTPAEVERRVDETVARLRVSVLAAQGLATT